MKLIILLILVSYTSLAATHTVVIEGLKFSPQSLKVKAGDEITWINKDFFPHTVTAINKSFDSKSIPASGHWKYSPKSSATFSYKCSFHPTMKGNLVVE